MHTSFESEVQSRKFDLDRVLHQLSDWLPDQGPVKDFIHHNTIHGFLDRPFEKAVWDASTMYGAFAFMPAQFYQQAFTEGRIHSSELERVFRIRCVPQDLQQHALDRLKSPVKEPVAQPSRGIAKCGIRAAWAKEIGVDVQSLSQPLLYKLLSSYLDQGISNRRFPLGEDFFQAIGRLVQNTLIPLVPLTDKNIRLQFSQPIDRVVLRCLEELVGDESLYQRYLHELFLSHPGWYSMVKMIERDPGCLLSPRSITLKQLVAVTLLIEKGWLCRRLGSGFRPLAACPDAVSALVETVATAPDKCIAIWHEAYEWSYYAQVLKGLQLQSRKLRLPRSPSPVQAVFCIDDREGGLRRHLEEVNSQVQTYATAGFFSVDFLYQGLNDSHPVKQCPLPVKPRHLVREILPATRKAEKQRPSHWIHLSAGSRTLIRGWLTTQVIGLWSGIKLLLALIKPTLSQPSLSSLSRIDASNPIGLYRQGDEVTAEGHFVGYSIDEMAVRVEAVFRNMGLTSGFGDLVFFIGHGSSSTNNPHFAAYDCGACSGHAGAPNARSIAIMANDPKVRELVRKRGIDLPPATRVVGAIHDTARDEVRYFDVDGLSENQQALMRDFETKMLRALAHNARERCRRFEMVSLSLTPEQALAEVKKRSSALFEPRPEYNHATNCVTIAGRRHLTYGLFEDRRALLQSYDPLTDQDGRILQGLLGALVPVCGGINLEYFFSRIDNDVYGAGTKLPHNVVSLIGVANGVEGDILTGLPAQMVEIHDPMRLLMVIEQEPDIALAALQREPALYRWAKNGWIYYCAMSPTTHEIFRLEAEKMVQVDLTPVSEIPHAANSAAVLASRTRDNIAVHLLGVES